MKKENILAALFLLAYSLIRLVGFLESDDGLTTSAIVGLSIGGVLIGVALLVPYDNFFERWIVALFLAGGAYKWGTLARDVEPGAHWWLGWGGMLAVVGLGIWLICDGRINEDTETTIPNRLA